MQVSHVSDHVTHAMIGGKAPIDMTMDDSAEFFHMLSTVLYKNQTLAVVRETMCNAWDAHIESGKTDQPIIITLNSEALIIKDFGKGIHYDNMGRIYGTYGRSTKRTDSTVTGGFGLGCKAPFAYTDNFEVTSCHEGTKTVYRLTKSSAKTMGKPAIVPIVDVPTTESGLTVTIPLKDPADMHMFLDYIKKVAFKGEILAELNGTVLPMLPLVDAPHDFVVVYDQLKSFNHETIMVRLGNVTYPVPRHDALSSLTHTINAYLRQLHQRTYYNSADYILVLMAKPNSISVTPSREALSEQDETISVLKEMLEKFLSYITENRELQLRNLYIEKSEELANSDHPGILFQESNKVPNYTPTEEDMIYESETFTRLGANSVSVKNYTKEYYDRILIKCDAILKTNPVNARHIKSYMHALRNEPEFIYTYNTRNTWLHKKVLAPLMSAVRSASKRSEVRVWNRKQYGRGANLVCPTNSTGMPLEEQFLFLHGAVVVGHKVADLARMAFHPAFREEHLPTDRLLFVRVPHKLEDVQAVKAAISSLGLRVLDFTKRLAGEPEPVVAPPKPVVKRKAGLPALSSLFKENKKIESMAFHTLDRDNKILRITKPKAIFETTKMLGLMQGFSMKEWKTINKHWGDVIGVCLTSTQLMNYNKKKVPMLHDFIIDKLLRILKTNKEFRNYMRFVIHRDEMLNHYSSDWLAIIYKDDILRKRYGIPDRPAPHVEELSSLLFHIVNKQSYSFARNRVTELRGELDKITVKASVQKLFTNIRKDNVISSLYILNEYNAGQIFSKTLATKEDEKNKTIIRNFIISALKD